MPAQEAKQSPAGASAPIAHVEAVTGGWAGLLGEEIRIMRQGFGHSVWRAVCQEGQAVRGLITTRTLSHIELYDVGMLSTVVQQGAGSCYRIGSLV